jgi:hypothetical protein
VTADQATVGDDAAISPAAISPAAESPVAVADVPIVSMMRLRR